MHRILRAFFLAVGCGLFASLAFAQTEPSACTLELALNGAVGPAVFDHFDRALQEAESRDCDSILFLINTPGGNLQTTRLLVERILESRRPVLCLVWPPGGHAGSAGAILLQACHVTGAAPGTNIGAATPIAGSGQDLPDDIRAKIIEDTRSWVSGLARLRGRNETFAEESVTKARALDAEEAVAQGAIDTVAQDVDSFLRFAAGRPVKMPGDRIEEVRTGPVVSFESGLRFRFLNVLTDPEFAYLLFIASLVLLYFEITHPGISLPGVLGGIGLIFSLIAFHKLDVTWGGVVLILMGMGFLVAEAFVPSFGVLGLGGLAAIGAGSILLYDPAVMGSRLSNGLVFGLIGTVGVGLLALGFVIFNSRKRAAGRALSSGVLGRIARVVSLESPSRRRGMLEVGGELWRFQSDRDVDETRGVIVTGRRGLTLQVKAVIENKHEGEGQ